MYIVRVVGSSVSQAVGLSLVILHQGFALGEPETGPSLEAFEHQRDYSRVRKIVWRANMEKIVRKNIATIYED